MRPVIWADVHAVARVIYLEQPHKRASLIDAIFVRAEAAHKYSKRYRRWHVPWGNGCLSIAAGGNVGIPDPVLNDRDYLQSVLMVLSGLEAWMDYKSALNPKRMTSISECSDPVPNA